MRHLHRVTRLMIDAAPSALFRGALASILVLAMGVALLGLSGWFITATGIAGLAGIGIAFDVFRPSAAIRFLAIGRTLARYGERMLTHDAVLRIIAALRVDLLNRYAGFRYRALQSLRGEAALTRITADVDALDGLILRLVLPSLSGLAVLLLATIGLAVLVDVRTALWICTIYAVGAAWSLIRLARRSHRPAARIEARQQALRRGIVDTVRDRENMILRGALRARQAQLCSLDERARNEALRLDLAERDTGFLLSATAQIAVAGSLFIGGWLVTQTGTGPAAASIAVFVALALNEAIQPLRRGFAEIGRITLAAKRLEGGDPHACAPTGKMTQADGNAPILDIKSKQGSFSLAAGEGAVLTGASGVGKTRMLMRIAGLETLDDTKIVIGGHDIQDWDEGALRDVLTILPQRSTLIRGSLRDNLQLATERSDADLWQVLDAVALSETVTAKGGLESVLGERGTGLSGGEARRLCLARALLKKPTILLLDEPTEGLDDATARAVLDGIRRYLPDAAILAASHQHINHPLFSIRISLQGDKVTDESDED